MRKNPHGRILKMELKEQHLNTVLKSYSYEKYLSTQIVIHGFTQLK